MVNQCSPSSLEKLVLKMIKYNLSQQARLHEFSTLLLDISLLPWLILTIPTLNYLINVHRNKRPPWNLLSKLISVHPRISVHPGNFAKS